MMKIIKIRKKTKEKKHNIKIKMMKPNQYKMIINPIEKNLKVAKKLLHQTMKMIMKLMIFHHPLFTKKLNKVKQYIV